jgi:hypothetical protein
LRDRLLDAVGAVDRDQLCTFPGEQQRCRAPDATARASNDDGFTFEAAHEFLLDSLVIDISSAKWMPFRLNKTGQNRSRAALRNSEAKFQAPR